MSLESSITPGSNQGRMQKLALLKTDSTQTPAADTTGLREASKPLRKAGIHVLAVGIGSGVD